MKRSNGTSLAGRFAALAVVISLALITACGTSPPQDSQPQVAATYRDAPHLAAHLPTSPAVPTPADDEEIPWPEAGTNAVSWPNVTAQIDLQSPAAADLRAWAHSEAFPGVEALPLEAVIVAVTTRHPSVSAARERANAIRAEYGELTAVKLVLRQYASFIRDLEPMVQPATSADMAPMAFPLPGPDGLRSRIIDAAAAAADAQWELAIRQRVRDARMLVARLQFYEVAAGIAADSRTLAESVRDIIEPRFQVGGAPLAEWLAVQTQIENFADRREDALAMADGTRRELVALLALPANATVTLTPQTFPYLALDASEADAEKLATHPTVITPRRQADRVALMVELVERMQRPSADMGTSRVPDPLGDGSGGMAGGMPRPWTGLFEAYHEELLHRQAAMSDAADAAFLSLQSATAAARSRYRIAAGELQLQAETLATLSAQSVTAAIDALGGSATTLEQVLAALQADQRVKLAAAEAVRDGLLAHAELEFLLGPLPTTANDGD